MTTKAENLDAFFPVPSAPPPQGPARLPGVTHASSAALVQALEDNHVKYHAFFNDRGFHNHISHHLVAIYALGAGGALIDAAYHAHAGYMRPAFASPETVDEKNFWTHLGKREFYNSYLEFFRSILREREVSDVLEEYVFSAKANVGGPGIEGEPKMLARFFAALVHPLIHTGNGLEFGLLGLVAEGLAQTAVHPSGGENLVPASLFEKKDAGAGAVSRLTALLPSLSLQKQKQTNGHSPKKTTGVHALSILARILADDKFSPASVGIPTEFEVSSFNRVNDVVGSALADLAAEWTADLEGDGATPEAISRKIEELAWASTVIYGVGGWGGRERSPTKHFNADFFYMHLVTSSLFLPSITAYLSPRSSAILLQGYFATTLAWFVSQGRATLPIREFYAKTTASPAPPSTSASASAAKGTLTPEDPAPNPWLPIVQTTLAHPDQHICKLQRALLHNATMYGTREAGHLADAGLEGAELLDGTLFVRVAGLSADRLGWMKEGQAEGDWDRAGFNY